MDNKQKKSKRIRHPKKKEEKQEIKQEEQPKHYTLDVHDSSFFNFIKFGK